MSFPHRLENELTVKGTLNLGLHAMFFVRTQILDSRKFSILCEQK